MSLLSWYKSKSYAIFSPYVEKYLSYFDTLKPDLQRSGLDMSLREYVSIVFATITLLFVTEVPLLAFIFSVIPGFTVPMVVLFSLTISLALVSGFLFFFYIYPSLVVGGRKRDIEYALPFATLYMATTSGSNAPPQAIFRVVAEFGEYGEVSRECAKIVRNMDVFGMDVVEAIRRVIEKSPSDQFKELLWGIITTVTTGGDMTSYLHERAHAYMQDYRRRLDEFAARLSTLLEIYLTLIIVGSIFFIVLTSIMAAFGLGGGLIELIVVLQFLVIFIGLPGISLGFIYVLRNMSPTRG